MTTHSTTASITSADFAGNGWFNTGTLTLLDIHPALRDPPAILDDTKDPVSDDHLIHSIFSMADLNIEGGGDKIAVPIFHNGADLTHIYHQPNYANWGSKPGVAALSAVGAGRNHEHPKYTVFPPMVESSSHSGDVFPKITPLKLKGPSRSLEIQRREAQLRSHQGQATTRDETFFLSFPTPPPSHPPPPPPSEEYPPESPTDPHCPPPLLSSNPAVSITSTPTINAPMTPPPRSSRRPSHISQSSSSSSEHSVPPLSSWSADSSLSTSTIHSPETRLHPFRRRRNSNSTAKTAASETTTTTTSTRKPFSFRNILKGAAPSPLIECAKSGDYTEALRLLAPGSNKNGTPALDTTDRGGFTALHWACKMGHTSIARALIARHANIEARTKAQDRTPLFLAATGGFTDIVASLLEAGAIVNTASTMDGATAIHAAAQQGHDLVITQLADAGADVNQRDVEGLPPLMWATQGRKLNAARALASRGANLNARIRLGANLELAPREGLTALHRAVMTSNHALARLFVELGADVDADGPNGMRPLHRAAMKGDMAMAALLIEGSASLGIVTEEGWTPLHVAAKQGHGNMCKLLVQSGAEEGILNHDGETARDLARAKGWTDLF